MAGQDPIHTITEFTTGITNAKSVLDKLDSLIGTTIGWTKDEYTTGAPFGAEMYLHTNSGFGSEAYFSFKACDDPDTDQSVLLCFANTGYDATKRVDNQPGMFARVSNLASNHSSVTTVFSGGATNASGDYQTNDSNPLNFGTATVYGPQAFKTSNLSKVWIVSDENASPGKRFIGLLWYLQNQLHAVFFGKPYYDIESGKLDGNFMAMICDTYANRTGTTVPQGATELSLSGASVYPISVIRNRTKGSTTYPAGTANGNSLALSNFVMIDEGRVLQRNILANNEQSFVPRPNKQASTGASGNDNAQQRIFAGGTTNTFGPAPRAVIAYDSGTGRRFLSRWRALSRYPDGGAFAFSSADYKDSGWFAPWYYAPTYMLSAGDIITNGTRRYMAFPFNIGGTGADPNRWSGIAFRMADA